MIKPTWRRHFRLPPFAISAKARAPHSVGNARKNRSLGHLPGHKKPGAPDSPSTIQDTKRYLQDFDRVQKTATSDQERFEEMTELYPHWVANQPWLMFGFPQP